MRRVFACRSLLWSVLTLGLVGPAPAVAQAAPTDPALAARLTQAETLIKQHRYDDAFKIYKDANRAEGNRCTPCLIGMSRADMHRGKLKDVTNEAAKALEFAGDDSQRFLAHDLRGYALVTLAREENKTNKLPEAEREFRAALALAPATPMVHFNLGAVLLRESRDADGIAELKRAINLAPAADFVAQAEQLIKDPRRARENIAPDFEVATLEGGSLSSSSLAGKVILLDFWATWCEPCRESLPDLQRLAQSFAGKPFMLVSINQDDDPGTWRAFLAKQPMPWTQAYDNKRAGDLYQVESIPTYIVIDSEGVIRTRFSGYMPGLGSFLQSEISQALRPLKKKHA